MGITSVGSQFVGGNLIVTCNTDISKRAWGSVPSEEVQDSGGLVGGLVGVRSIFYVYMRNVFRIRAFIDLF
jgi:hypothetical protein